MGAGTMVLTRGMGGGASTLKKRSVCWLHLLTDRMPVSDAGGAGSSPAGAGAVCVGAPIVLQEQ